MMMFDVYYYIIISCVLICVFVIQGFLDDQLEDLQDDVNPNFVEEECVTLFFDETYFLMGANCVHIQSMNMYKEAK